MPTTATATTASSPAALPFASFADCIATWLLAERLSYTAAGDRLAVSPSTVAGWRAGRSSPTRPVIRRLAPLLGLTESELSEVVARSVPCPQPRLDASLRYAARVLGLDPVALARFHSQSRPVAAVAGS
jgi:transcriptional regulator with XRE-family HTH domain